MWIQRYEKEQQDHTQTNGSLLMAKSDLKDSQLATKNSDIKLATVSRQVEILKAQNDKFMNQMNESTAKQENLERDLNTQKEIMKNFQQTKKEYIDKLKKDLDTVEERFIVQVNQAQMYGEDLRSRAFSNFHNLMNLRVSLKDSQDTIDR